MDLSFYIALGVAILASGVAILKVVAPATATTVDDEWLARLEAVESAVESMLGKTPAAPQAEAPKVA